MAHELADDLEGDAADDDVPADADDDLDQLGDQLLRVAVEEAGDAAAGDAEVVGRADAVPALAVAAVGEQTRPR